ncbi:MAG TPA: phosphoribosylformylglycinamidine synthase subunit PurS [Candidatus Methylomirabilis sp.]
MVKVRVLVTLKPGVLDPQGKTVRNALESLGFKGLTDLRIGKVMEIKMDGVSPQEARAQVEEMCQKLLANPVIEDYRYEVEEASAERKPAARRDR